MICFRVYFILFSVFNYFIFSSFVLFVTYLKDINMNYNIHLPNYIFYLILNMVEEIYDNRAKKMIALDPSKPIQ